MPAVCGKSRLPVRGDSEGKIAIDEPTPRSSSGFGERGSIVGQVTPGFGVSTENDDDAFVVFAQRRPRQPRFTARGVITGMCSTHQAT